MKEFPFRGPLAGRWYLCEGDCSRIVDMVARVREYAFREHVPVRHRNVGFCTSAVPWSGEVDADRSDVSYDVDDGVCRMWLRQDERSVPRHARERHARDMWLAGDFCRQNGRLPLGAAGVPWETVTGELRKQVLQAAEDYLLPSVLPKTKIIPVLVVDRLVFAGALQDIGLSKLTTVFGGMKAVSMPSLDDLVQETWLKRGWSDLAGRALKKFLVVEDGRLDADFRLTAIRLRCGELLLAGGLQETDQALARPRNAVRSLVWGAGPLDMDRDFEVIQMTCEVEDSGERTVIVLDETGLSQAVPPNSSGGVAAVRIRRRVKDIVTATERAVEVLTSL